MAKKSYDCVLVETSESENLYIDEIQETLKLLPKNEQISVFDTGFIIKQPLTLLKTLSLMMKPASITLKTSLTTYTSKE